ncbi:MAG: sensor hybrid histidine kinase [Caulobacter sp.]|nr:sensor hybrid histidine kinase [Caulobacter sp.]
MGVNRNNSATPPDPGALDILEANQDCLWILTLDGHIDYMNQRARALVEAKADNRKTWRDLWPEESRFSLDRVVAGAAAGQVSRFRAFFPTARRTRTYWDTVVSPVGGDGVSPTRLLAVSRDVTTEVETQAFLETVIQLLPSPLTVKTVDDGRYVLVNRAAEEAFGYMTEDPLGEIALGLMGGVLKNGADGRLTATEAEVLRTGEMRTSEEAIRLTANAEARYFLTKTLATYDDVGPRHLVTLAEDITERRSAAASLHAALEAAEQASQAKSAFLANMSHEIRTPLNGIVAGADMLAKDALTPRGRELVEIITTSSQTLERLLSDVLDLVRVEAGQLVIETAPFHLGDLARSVSALSSLRAEEKGVALRAALPPEVETVVVGDGLRLRQVLTNLLSNAVKFTDQGAVTLDLAWRDDGTVRFTVTDTGVGFDMASKDTIFGRFQQVDTSFTRRFGGSGLGLAISRDLVALMGGELVCDSAPGVGSSFWFELALPPAAAPGATLDAGAPTADQELRVLIVDDHPTNRKIVELMLADHARLFSAEDGEQAVDLFRRTALDLVLMDMQMPVMDGLSAVREIRQIEHQTGRARTPIIMLTANARPEHVRASREAGADLHLEKPITTLALFTAMETALTPVEAVDADQGARL